MTAPKEVKVYLVTRLTVSDYSFLALEKEHPIVVENRLGKDQMLCINKSDHDQEVQATRVNLGQKIHDLHNEYESQVQALKADLERLVKEIGLEKHWLYYINFGLADFKVVRKLSQEIGEKWKIKYE